MTELLVGDPAPGLMLGEFLKGEPIATVVTGKFYAIEFLDINMRPLQDEHPPTHRLQKIIPQVAIIGDTKSRYKAARSFVAEMDAQIGYRIALNKLHTQSDGQQLGPFLLQATDCWCNRKCRLRLREDAVRSARDQASCREIRHEQICQRVHGRRRGRSWPQAWVIAWCGRARQRGAARARTIFRPPARRASKGRPADRSSRLLR
jgi:hypothetical protein